jgi:hypothetical protein
MAERSTVLEVQKRTIQHTSVPMALDYGGINDDKVNQVWEKVPA